MTVGIISIVPLVSQPITKKGGEDLKGNFKFIAVSILLPAILMGAIGCSNTNAECKVTLDRSKKLDIIVNPPGETGESSQEGALQRNLLISSSGGEIERVTNYVGGITKTYVESGHEYEILIDIFIKDEKLTDYTLTVTGGIYGDAPHTCTFP
ncbi:MAG: hypothetical protein Q8L87_00680 [Anaerolineales bacterium]|nr:hypothetical protein [Anaerolineales bacterium]